MRVDAASSTNTARRVLFPFVGDSVGGSHISALELAKGLDTSRFEPVIALHQKGILWSYLQDRGIATVQLRDLIPDPLHGRFRRYALATLLVSPGLTRFLRRLRIDIVHTHDARMHFLWGPVSKMSLSKFVLHLRDSSQSNITYSSFFADSILSISEYCRKEFPARIANRAKVVPNPCRPPPLLHSRNACRRKLLRSAGLTLTDRTNVVVGYVANFVERKRPLLFVKIAALLRDRLGDRVAFPMFGNTDGVQRKDLVRKVNDAIAEHGLASQCVLMGSRFPIEPWMMGCDVLIAPAVREAYGRTLVEAMLCGTPVVAADDGGHREIIHHGETGLLVPADDAPGFADAVVKLHTNPRLAKSITSAAKACALTTHSVTVHVERIQSIYDSLMK